MKGDLLMNVKSIIKSVSSIKLKDIPATVSKGKLLLKKHSPDILLIAGGTLIVASTVAACYQTLKAKNILEKADDDIKKINYGEDVANGDSDFDATTARKERMKVYSHLGLDMVKLYGPCVVGELLGLGMIFGSHKILKDRNTTLAAAYSSLLTTYTTYRERVRERIGVDEEIAVASGADHMDIVSEDENGQRTRVKNAPVVHDDGSTHSEYARIFDEYCKNWKPSPSENLVFLRSQQNFANDKLRSEGFVFLNDIYRMLGFPATPAGQIVGWVYDPDDPTRDNYIDFGIYDAIYKSPARKDFINAAEPSVWLDFNVDGVIYNLI